MNKTIKVLSALCVTSTSALTYAPEWIAENVRDEVNNDNLYERPARRSHVIDKLKESPVWNEDLSGSLLSSKFYRHMGIQDIEEKMDELMYDFPELVRVDSIGKTFEKADIPLLTIADPEGEVPIDQRPAILLTGATHARDLLTI